MNTKMAFLLISLFLCSIPITYGQEAASQSKNQNLGSCRGKVNLGVKGADLSHVGPLVVYLEFLETTAQPDRTLDHQVVNINQIAQKFANFIPNFVVVTVGQTLRFPNNDTITHNVFSYSKPNDFDLGLYPKGTSKSYSFQHPGPVRIYCSIHKSMQGTIFVAPTAYHTLVSTDGTFEIKNIAPGSFRIKTWNNVLPETTSEIQIQAQKTSRIDLTITGE